ncbi:hypothetical protein AVDCRST_MAG84-7439 [uncultured Microcoleus sp.]|uniref:Uncharacterized protein n=1 Tax=uncultured Microcoleus sp. TaxID=259945 RepID=A0A6J4Q158_9CYAN|nr:hypothetical protein AVDCRST_MAG84-7439 [uncultured Microcoleus sp.]
MSFFLVIVKQFSRSFLRRERACCVLFCLVVDGGSRSRDRAIPPSNPVDFTRYAK